MDKNLLKVNDHRRTMALLCLKTKKHLNEIWPLIKSQLLLRGIVIVYSCFEKGCRRKCTRQSRKVLWVGFEFTVLERNLKEWYERPWTMFPSAKAKQQKQVQQLQCQKQCIDHIPYYISGLSCALFFRCFSKQLYIINDLSKKEIPYVMYSYQPNYKTQRCNSSAKSRRLWSVRIQDFKSPPNNFSSNYAHLRFDLERLNKSQSLQSPVLWPI